MVTTKDQETDKVWAMRQGAKDYIVKPAKEKDLVERVNGLLST
jgi:twitching motility two-component system response regulator PilH